MKYAVIKVVNGNFSVSTEHGDNLNGAKVAYHALCETLWNASDVETAEVRILDENLDTVEDFKEYISHVEKTTEG